jgi:hypothetical protein
LPFLSFIQFSKEEGVVADPQGQLPIFEFDPLYPAVKPLFHLDEGIEEGSRNMYLCMV